MLDKVDAFPKNYDGTKYLVLFGLEKCNVTYDRIRCIIALKIGVIYDIFYAKIKTDSDNYLPLEKTLTLQNVAILIKSVFNKSQNHYN